ncbi:MAG: hypothetical protein WC010_01785 [Candidatus Absconditabacterales bacterium]
MKKNFVVIATLVVALLGTLTLINKASAATANVTLSVTAGAFSCSQYPTAVDFGSTPTAISATLLTGDSWTGSFACNDFAATWGSQMLAQSTALTGATTGIIAPMNITWTPSGSITQTAGNCNGLSLGAGGTLDVAETIISKVGLNTCSFTYAPDGMTVNVPAYSPVNAYTAVMTITDPA